jgi:hypothetical protein
MRRRILRRKELLFTACGLMVCLWLATGAHAQIRLDNKKMIQFGWDEPDPAFMRKHIRRMEQSPFDGTVFHISYRSKNGRTGNFTWEAWGRTLFSERDLNDARKDLRRTRFRRFQHNFLRFNVTPADLDWFDDYSAVIGNARLAGKLARQGKARGILLDTETYKEALFDYRKQRDSGTKSWEEYAAQARRRGREIMQAFQRDFPGITIFLTMGYELPWLRCVADSRPLWECDY